MEHRVPNPAAARCPSAVLLVLALAALSPAGVSAQEEVPVDRGSIALGRDLFLTYCASCHGREARGDGSLAEFLRVTPADLTRLSEDNGGEFPFEEVEKQIDRREIARAHGSDMPVWGDAFEKLEDSDPADVEEKILSLVHYLRSIQVTEDESGS